MRSTRTLETRDWIDFVKNIYSKMINSLFRYSVDKLGYWFLGRNSKYLPQTYPHSLLGELLQHLCAVTGQQWKVEDMFYTGCRYRHTLFSLWNFFPIYCLISRNAGCVCFYLKKLHSLPFLLLGFNKRKREKTVQNKG